MDIITETEKLFVFDMPAILESFNTQLSDCWREAHNMSEYVREKYPKDSHLRSMLDIHV